MAKTRFYWKSTCSTCRDARSFILNDLGVAVDERNYAKEPLTIAELREIFSRHDPRKYLNPKSPAYKAMGLKDKSFTPEEALELIAKEPNLLKRPLTITGRKMIAGFDREALREALAS